MGQKQTKKGSLVQSALCAKQFRQVQAGGCSPAYNQALLALAAEMGVKYYDCTSFLKDSTGWLKSSYNAGDGVHWKSAAYHEYAKLLTAYDKSLDERIMDLQTFHID